MLAVLLAQAVASPLSGWWYIGDMGAKPQRTVIYASLHTRQIDHDVARVWTWTVNEKLSESGRESTKTLWEHRCSTSQQRSLMIVGYDRTGASTGSISNPSAWNYVVPDSNGAKILAMACQGKSEGMLPVLKAQGTPVEVARELFQED